MIINKKHRGIFGVLVMMIWGLGCTQLSPTAQLEAVVKSSANCIAPCWNGIVPGKSSGNDFLMLVNESSQRQFASLERSETPYKKQVGFIWQDQKFSFEASAFISSDVVMFLKFMEWNNLTIGTVFDSLGYPTTYTAEIYQGESYLLNMNLFYEKIGLIIHIFIVPFESQNYMFPPSCQVNITTDMLVHSIYLVKPGSADGLLEILYPAISSYGEPKAWSGIGLLPLTSCS